MINTLVTTIQKTKVVFDSAKWIVPKSIQLNSLNIMKVTRAVGFMKTCVGSIFSVIDNWLKFSLSIYIYYHKSCYMKHTISPIRKSDENHNSKKDSDKYRHATFLVLTGIPV